jgi:hypothetical protein
MILAMELNSSEAGTPAFGLVTSEKKKRTLHQPVANGRAAAGRTVPKALPSMSSISHNVFSYSSRSFSNRTPIAVTLYVLGGMLFSIHEVVNCHEGWTSVHFVAFLHKVVEANLQDVMMPP